jgi:hypothetical protein
MLPHMKILPTICYCVTAIVIAWIVSLSGRFQVREASGVPFVLNQNTGEISKFYINTADANRPGSMGFQRFTVP